MYFDSFVGFVALCFVALCFVVCVVFGWYFCWLRVLMLFDCWFDAWW